MNQQKPNIEIKGDFALFSSYLYTGKIPKEIKISSFWDIPDAIGIAQAFTSCANKKKDILQNKLKHIFLQEECYNNAMKAWLLGTQKLDFLILYTEGEAVYSGLPFALPTIHAWNYIPEHDLYFDLTWELHLENEVTKNKYYPVVQGSIPELTQQGYNLNSQVDLFTQWLNRPENEPPENSIWHWMSSRTGTYSKKSDESVSLTDTKTIDTGLD